MKVLFTLIRILFALQPTVASDNLGALYAPRVGIVEDLIQVVLLPLRWIDLGQAHAASVQCTRRARQYLPLISSALAMAT